MIERMDSTECLRREYFSKQEKSAPSPRGLQDKGDFFFDGHRLSSLYRRTTLRVEWLMIHEQIGFFFVKILKNNFNQVQERYR
ncbi:MAG: hypothetical protein AAED33_08505 [Paracoccaceae bacterium]|jgi:hypothetical protein